MIDTKDARIVLIDSATAADTGTSHSSGLDRGAGNTTQTRTSASITSCSVDEPTTAINPAILISSLPPAEEDNHTRNLHPHDSPATTNPQSGESNNLHIHRQDTNTLQINRIFITDRRSNQKVLVDTGADCSCLPRPVHINPRTFRLLPQERIPPKLFAANNTPIDTYGYVRVKLILGTRREYVHEFIYAEVPHAIIGIDLLK